MILGVRSRFGKVTSVTRAMREWVTPLHSLAPRAKSLTGNHHNRLLRSCLEPIRLAHNVHRVAHRPPLRFSQSTANHLDINPLTTSSPLAPRMQFSRCLRARGKTGVSLDDFVRDRIRTDPIRDSGACRSRDSCGRCSQEARLVARSDRSLPDLLRPDDHAHRRARPDHRIAARPDPRTLPRQHRTLRRQAEGRPGERSNLFRPDPGSRDPDHTDPDPVNPYPVNPYPVNPGSSQSDPVFPGRTTTTRAEPVSQAESLPDALKAGTGSGGRRPHSDHDMKSIGDTDRAKRKDNEQKTITNKIREQDSN
jgi:hypothetical protein